MPVLLAELKAIAAFRAVVLQYDERIVGLAGLFRVDTAGVGAPVRKKRRRHLFRQADLLGGEEAVIPPQTELAASSFAEIAVLALRDICAAAGAFSDHGSARRKERFRTLHRRTLSHKGRYQLADSGEERIRVRFAAFDLFQPVFSLSGEQQRLKLFGQYGDKGHACGGGDQMHGLLCALSFREACGNELFNDSRAGGGCADSFSFSIFRHILFARRFHSGPEQVF